MKCFLARRRGGRTRLGAVSGGSAACEMDSWGYFMGDARLGTRKRERLPVTCMFWLDRGLGQRAKPVAKYQDKVKAQTVVRRQLTQKPVAHVKYRDSRVPGTLILDFLHQNADKM